MKTRCEQCGKEMNPVEAILGAVCGDCCRLNHAKVTGRAPKARRRVYKKRKES